MFLECWFYAMCITGFIIISRYTIYRYYKYKLRRKNWDEETMRGCNTIAVVVEEVVIIKTKADVLFGFSYIHYKCEFS